MVIGMNVQRPLGYTQAARPAGVTDGSVRSSGSGDAGKGEAKKEAGPSAQANRESASKEEIQRQVLKLKARESAVVAHETAHKAVGGQYAGAVSYEYTKGPDGNQYISGGEVSIDISPAKDNAETVRKMRQVKAAAMAPADPSPQDRNVAAKATTLEMEAQGRLARELMSLAYQQRGVSDDSSGKKDSVSIYA